MRRRRYLRSRSIALARAERVAATLLGVLVVGGAPSIAFGSPQAERILSSAGPPGRLSRATLGKAELRVLSSAGPPGRLSRATLGKAEPRYEELEARVERLEEQRAWDEQRAREVVRWRGYVDTGFFAVQDTGAGVRSDFGHNLFPEVAGVVPDRWVFVGDPLSTAINARGEPADTGDSRALSFDSVDSRGKASFILNAVNLGVSARAPGGVSVNVLVDLVPRGRDMSDTSGLFLGDYLDLKLAHLRWVAPVRRFDLELEAGKIDSVFGLEYRIQETPSRTEVTPSLICRYTCGRPIGVRARAEFGEGVANLAASVTNGSSYQETFAFYDEVDSNSAKTLTGRFGLVLPTAGRVELGASGQLGAQDLQDANDALQWQHGVDLHVSVRDFFATVELLQGRASGRTSAPSPDDGLRPEPCDLAPCLRVIGGYASLGYRVRNWLTPFARVDWRDATHGRGTEYVYFSQLVRITPGLRFDVGTNLAVKVQYTVNVEVDRVPQIPNDTFTSSVVAHF